MKHVSFDNLNGKLTLISKRGILDKLDNINFSLCDAKNLIYLLYVKNENFVFDWKYKNKYDDKRVVENNFSLYSLESNSINIILQNEDNFSLAIKKLISYMERFEPDLNTIHVRKLIRAIEEENIKSYQRILTKNGYVSGISRNGEEYNGR